MKQFVQEMEDQCGSRAADAAEGLLRPEAEAQASATNSMGLSVGVVDAMTEWHAWLKANPEFAGGDERGAEYFVAMLHWTGWAGLTKELVDSVQNLRRGQLASNVADWLGHDLGEGALKWPVRVGLLQAYLGNLHRVARFARESVHLSQPYNMTEAQEASELFLGLLQGTPAIGVPAWLAEERGGPTVTAPVLSMRQPPPANDEDRVVTTNPDEVNVMLRMWARLRFRSWLQEASDEDEGEQDSDRLAARLRRLEDAQHFAAHPTPPPPPKDLKATNARRKGGALANASVDAAGRGRSLPPVPTSKYPSSTQGTCQQAIDEKNPCLCPYVMCSIGESGQAHITGLLHVDTSDDGSGLRVLAAFLQQLPHLRALLLLLPEQDEVRQIDLSPLLPLSLGSIDVVAEGDTPLALDGGEDSPLVRTLRSVAVTHGGDFKGRFRSFSAAEQRRNSNELLGWTCRLKGLTHMTALGPIGTVPSCIGELTDLVSLDLRGARLRSWPGQPALPPSLRNLNKMRSFIAFGQGPSHCPPRTAEVETADESALLGTPGWIAASTGTTAGGVACALRYDPRTTMSEGEEAWKCSHMTWRETFDDPDQVWWSWPELRRFWVDANGFSGTVPEWLADKWPELVTLDLYDNGFTGSLPQSFCDLPNLRELRLQQNNFTGPLPTCWSDGSIWERTPQLAFANLDYNPFLTGTVVVPDRTWTPAQKKLLRRLPDALGALDIRLLDTEVDLDDRFRRRPGATIDNVVGHPFNNGKSVKEWCRKNELGSCYEREPL